MPDQNDAFRLKDGNVQPHVLSMDLRDHETEMKEAVEYAQTVMVYGTPQQVALMNFSSGPGLRFAALTEHDILAEKMLRLAGMTGTPQLPPDPVHGRRFTWGGRATFGVPSAALKHKRRR